MNKSEIKTLNELVEAAAAEYGDKTFLKEKAGKEIAEKSFNDFFSDSKKINTFINEKSGGRTIHAAVIGTTSYSYLVSYFGTVFGGNTIVPIDAQLSCEDICDLLNRADIEIFFYSKRCKDMLPEMKKNCPNIHTYVSTDIPEEELSVSRILGEYAETAPKKVDPELMAAILYTSGTTGKSKGVMLAHRCLIDNTMCQDNESSTEDVILSVLPIHHVYCFTCDILCSIRYGTTVCVNESMMRIGMNLQLFKPTIILLVPMIAETIYKQIKAASAAKPEIPMAAIAKNVFGGNLKGIFCGGAYLSPELANSYLELGIPIAQGYGMTECSPRITTATFDDTTTGHVGSIVNGCQVKIVDGEIRAKSPSVMLGYYKDEASTKEAITEDGWLCTGDLGYVDELNHVVITGRKKNLIILSNGENVSPEEVENKFAGIDLVAEILVYAEDGMITAEIYPSPEASKDMDKAEIIAKLKEYVEKINPTLTSAKMIRKLRMRDVEFDKTTSKKIRRQQPVQGEIV